VVQKDEKAAHVEKEDDKTAQFFFFNFMLLLIAKIFLCGKKSHVSKYDISKFEFRNIKIIHRSFLIQAKRKHSQVLF